MNLKSFYIAILCTILFSSAAVAGGGNPTGGFGGGADDASSSQPIFPTGNFSTLDSGSEPETDPGAPPPSAPIDGGASILIGAGLAIGGRKLYKELKK